LHVLVLVIILLIVIGGGGAGGDPALAISKPCSTWYPRASCPDTGDVSVPSCLSVCCMLHCKYPSPSSPWSNLSTDLLTWRVCSALPRALPRPSLERPCQCHPVADACTPQWRDVWGALLTAAGPPQTTQDGWDTTMPDPDARAPSYTRGPAGPRP